MLCAFNKATGLPPSTVLSSELTTATSGMFKAFNVSSASISQSSETPEG